MPHKNGLKIKNSYVSRVLYSIYNDYGINMNETRVIVTWCYRVITKFTKITKGFLPSNLI